MTATITTKRKIKIVTVLRNGSPLYSCKTIHDRYFLIDVLLTKVVALSCPIAQERSRSETVHSFRCHNESVYHASADEFSLVSRCRQYTTLFSITRLCFPLYNFIFRDQLVQEEQPTTSHRKREKARQKSDIHHLTD
jgi:hypothetical protein